eukprot:TRINITY_DN1742_c2_g2_i1.p1 TRINITY_DN1742_c2_g2~~TRINITY_DN1742_c2_g2_i1.p1  ORF type:complete len:1051 (+),score=185.89 TRINITY_DN1742_c2_g2_i1:133-3285(+)
MVLCGGHRKERVHTTGVSNRTASMLVTGPINFDGTMRSTLPSKMSYINETQVPMTSTGDGNRDLGLRLPGHDYRQPKSDPRETRRLLRETKEMEATLKQQTLDATIPVLKATNKDGTMMEQVRTSKQKGHKPAPRWNPRHWYEAPAYEQVPLQKDEGCTWNSMESQKVQGEIKGQDRLFRTVRRPEDVSTPKSEVGRPHPLDYDRNEYYPGRSQIDAVVEEPGNDFQVRPVNLPDFYNPPPEDTDSVARMQRLREVIKQRYAGRPRLMGVFKSCSLRKPGYVFPRDLRQVFDQMGIKVSEPECDMLVKAVDKDAKGAATFEEFADLIYGPRVVIGGAKHEPQERHVRHVTKTLVDNLISSGQTLGKAFCELDPERKYMISKEQFANALGTACNHISNQAVDFLWASQFPGQEGRNCDHEVIDWRGFMGQLAHFSHDNRQPTPCCVQGRKRQYDLLQRTVPLTNGFLEDMDLNRPDQNADDEVHIVADQLVHRSTNLHSKPRDAAMLTEHYVDVLRTKALRVERALPQRVPKARLKELLKNRDCVHQDDLIDMIVNEIEAPRQQDSLAAQEPIYMSSGADVMTLDPAQLAAQEQAGAGSPSSSKARPPVDDGGGYPPPASLKIVRGDVEAYVATQRHNRDYEVDVKQFIDNVYRPTDEKKAIEYVNDGLNRALRGNRPPRERPQNLEVQRYSNYWQARHVMEALQDAIAEVENSNGGKVKASKMFKRLDIDNDGYLTLSDLRTACEKFKIPNTSADLHAAFTELDKHDNGSVDIGEFTRNYEVHQGNLLDNMMKPIKSVYHEGGVEFGGPVQEKIDAREKEIMDNHIQNSGGYPGGYPMPASPMPAGSEASRSHSEPPGKSSSRNGLAKTMPPGTGNSQNSQMSRTGASIASGKSTPLIYETHVDRMMGRGRVSDVIRSRFNAWKPGKEELYTSLAKTRYGMTIYPDTRHITEPSVPLCAHGMSDAERFKTTNNVRSLFATPDCRDPQAEDTMRKHARNEYRVEKIRHRQREFAERCWAANEAANQFDEMKVARKALNLLNYERKCHMACA